jgi:hypothetical protein
MLPVLSQQIRDLTADAARSARPHAPVRRTETAPAAATHRSPGAARRALAAALRRSADRLAPAIE